MQLEFQDRHELLYEDNDHCGSEQAVYFHTLVILNGPRRFLCRYLLALFVPLIAVFGCKLIIVNVLERRIRRNRIAQKYLWDTVEREHFVYQLAVFFQASTNWLNTCRVPLFGNHALSVLVAKQVEL